MWGFCDYTVIAIPMSLLTCVLSHHMQNHAVLQLETINWQLSLEIAQKSKSKQKTPRAVFDLGIKDTATQVPT